MLRPDRRKAVLYRSRDHVRHLRLRVRLRRVTAAQLVRLPLSGDRAPTAAAAASAETGALLLRVASHSSKALVPRAALAGAAEEERLIRWQEKIFGKVPSLLAQPQDAVARVDLTAEAPRQAEILRYRDREQCTTLVQEEYHEDLVRELHHR
jgi:hypothetical protein